LNGRSYPALSCFAEQTDQLCKLLSKYWPGSAQSGHSRMLVNMGDKGAQSVQHPFVSRDKATVHLALVKRGVGEETVKKKPDTF